MIRSISSGPYPYGEDAVIAEVRAVARGRADLLAAHAEDKEASTASRVSAPGLHTWSGVPGCDTITSPSDVARRYRIACRGVTGVTRQYVVGELSVRLENLQAVGERHVAAVARLRADAESSPPWALAAVLVRALALADRMCWDALAGGDIARFRRQAEIAADLRCFGVCARLISDEP
jgi:hypothetical protein